MTGRKISTNRVMFIITVVIGIFIAGCSKAEEAAKQAGENKATEIMAPANVTSLEACKVNMSTFNGFIEQYYQDKGTWLSSLSELVPGYARTVPVCPQNNAAYRIDPVTHRLVCPNGHTN